MFTTNAELLAFDLVLEIEPQLFQNGLELKDQLEEMDQDKAEGFENDWYHQRMLETIYEERAQLEALADALWDDYCGRMPVGPGQLELPLPV